MELPLSSRFDLIASIMTLHQMKDTGKMVTCFAKHLKPQGKIVLANLNAKDGTF